MASTTNQDTYKVRTLQIPLLADEEIHKRFWAKVIKTGGCWQWIGSKGGKNYGRFYFALQSYAAHRVAYTWGKGVIPQGLTLDHICRNSLCVNPDHLEPVTNKENVLRGVGITANNSRKTHCKRGHRLVGNNTIKRRLGRECRECDRQHYRDMRARRRAQGEAK